MITLDNKSFFPVIYLDVLYKHDKKGIDEQQKRNDRSINSSIKQLARIILSFFCERIKLNLHFQFVTFVHIHKCKIIRSQKRMQGVALISSLI